MIKSYKIRLYPTKEQEQLMWQHVGCARFIYNYMLAKQEELYEAGEKHLSHFDMINLLKPLKNDGEHEWLYEVSNTTLKRVCGLVVSLHHYTVERYTNESSYDEIGRSEAASLNLSNTTGQIRVPSFSP